MRFLKEKSILSTVFLALISLALCLGFSACAVGDSATLTNGGFIVEGGGFERGCVLEAGAIDDESEEYSRIVSAIADYDYDKTKPVYVFELSVKKDGVKVQPDGKAKVTITIGEDLTGYGVLHVKDDGKAERLSMTYKDGKATFETNSFSYFAFVKKLSADGGEDGESGDETKYTFKAIARRIVPFGRSDGGAVFDAYGENITYSELKLAEGTRYTVKSNCYPDYYFVGWYAASEYDEATAETLISKETAYTFTIDKDLTICALYAYKTDVVELTLDAKYEGFSYRNGKPTKTLVAKNSEDLPRPDDVYVYGVLGNGQEKSYRSKNFPADGFNEDITIDYGGFDCSRSGEYTITYSYNDNPNVHAKLDVQVSETGKTLKVSTNDKNLEFRYNNGEKLNNYEAVLPEGKLVTLTAYAADGYAFIGWYNDSDDGFVSKDLVYCFEMPDSDVSLYGKYEKSDVSLEFSVQYGEGELVDAFENAYIWQIGTKYFKKGETVKLTARACDTHDFKGWYERNGSEYVLITENRTLNITLNENKSVKAQFNEKLSLIEVDPAILENEGFMNGQLVVSIGDGAVDYENFKVYARGVTGSYEELSAEDYTIEDNDVDFSRAGEYAIAYTYKYNSDIKAELKIVVIDPQNIRFSFEKGYSYLDHEYNGKATFISLKDVKVNGIPLYDVKTNSKIREKISYRWIDTTTNEEADTNNVDITINGVVVKDFGPANEKMIVGNEFGGPIKAGSYRFELIYDGKTVLTQESTITTRAYKKITSSREFTTNIGSSWINFELYYYTIVGYADGKYFVMQMPTVGYGEYEAEAREVSVDANGNILLGEGNDFAFVNAKYYTTDNSGYTEFLTGYYGSYVVRSSGNTVDGTLFGSPYIYRTGYTSVSGGRIYREYGTKEYYGNKTEFAADGAVTIYSRYYGEAANNRLRLVKDGDRYVFTSVAEDRDTARPSYDVFIYQSVITSNDQGGDK